MAKCKNCKYLDTVQNDLRSEPFKWCVCTDDSPVLDMERDCENYAPMTNADRIRSMTDEELAEWITNMCEFERHGEPYKSIYNLDTYNEEEIHDSYGDLLSWLKAEREEQ